MRLLSFCNSPPDALARVPFFSGRGRPPLFSHRRRRRQETHDVFKLGE